MNCWNLQKITLKTNLLSFSETKDNSNNLFRTFAHIMKKAFLNWIRKETPTKRKTSSYNLLSEIWNHKIIWKSKKLKTISKMPKRVNKNLKRKFSAWKKKSPKETQKFLNSKFGEKSTNFFPVLNQAWKKISQTKKRSLATRTMLCNSKWWN